MALEYVLFELFRNVFHLHALQKVQPNAFGVRTHLALGLTLGNSHCEILAQSIQKLGTSKGRPKESTC